VPIRDDEQFKQYLSEFKPLSADPLPIESHSPATWRLWIYALSAAVAFAVVVALLVAVHLHRKPAGSRSAQKPTAPTSIEQLANSQPLTLQRANDLLAHAPSFKAALDGVAFRRQPGKLPQGSQSALATLSKEDIKL
jgi:hypothetical protein